MTRIKIPRRAVVMFVGCMCCGKSALSQKILAGAPTQSAKIFCYDAEMQRMLTRSGTRKNYAVKVSGGDSVLTPEMVPTSITSQFNHMLTAQMIETVRQYDLTVVDGLFDDVDTTDGVIQAIDQVRDDRVFVLIKIAPDKSVMQQLIKMRERQPDDIIDDINLALIHVPPTEEDLIANEINTQRKYLSAMPRSTEYYITNPFTTEFVFA